MKPYIFFISLFFLVACNKSREKSSCPEINAKDVPASVMNAFHAKYPNAIADKWYNKDNSGYTASFALNGANVHSLFDKEGNLVKEELNETDEYANSNPEEEEEEGGCNCESKEEVK